MHCQMAFKMHGNSVILRCNYTFCLCVTLVLLFSLLIRNTCGMQQLFVFLLNVNVNCRKDLFLLDFIVCRVIPCVMGHFSGYDTKK